MKIGTGNKSGNWSLYAQFWVTDVPTPVDMTSQISHFKENLFFWLKTSFTVSKILSAHFNCLQAKQNKSVRPLVKELAGRSILLKFI